MESEHMDFEHLDALPFLIWISDVNGICTKLNRFWSDFCGVDGKTDVNNEWQNYVHPDDLEVTQTKWNVSIKELSPYITRFRLLHHNGHYVWFEASAVPILDSETGFAKSWVGYCKDVSSTIKFEEELQSQQLLLSTTLEQLPIGVGIVHTDEEKILFANEKLKSFKVHEMMNCSGDCSNWEGYHISQGSTFDKHALREMIQSGRAVDTVVVKLVNRDKQQRTVSMTSRPVYNSNAEVMACVVLCEDHDEKVRVESEKLAAAEREALAVEANKMKNNFIANMSHEMKTPLHSILGLVNDLTMNETSMSNDYHDTVDAIRGCVKSLDNLVNRTLNLSKIYAGKMALSLEPFSIKTFLSEVICDGKRYALGQQKDIVFHHRVQGRLPNVVVGDLTKVREIYANVISNAVKFSKNFGTVAIETLCNKISPQVLHLVTTVTDEGIGMDEDLVEKIFVPFSQSDTSTTRTFGGTGLGLTLCKELLKLIQGTISVSSARGQGTKVTISCPFHIQKQKPVCNEPLIDRQSIKILLAEDNFICQKIAKQYLKRGGYTSVVTVDNGEQAVELFKQSHFDLILMDCQMPVCDGFEATRRIRTFEKNHTLNKKIPIIAFTASSSQDEYDECYTCGMNDIILKPAEEHAFLTRIDKSLIKNPS